jgi:nucleotide-binding universal stress UspA family protein
MTVLATIDNHPGCGRVVETAEELATGLGHELIVLHVLPEGETESDVRAELEGIVDAAVGEASSPELRIVPEPATRDVPTGRTAKRVLEVAEQVDPAYLVIGSRKRTAVGKVLLGSVSQLVLGNADVPVVTVEQAT